MTKVNLWTSITDIWLEDNKNYLNLSAIEDNYSNIKLSYFELINTIRKFAAGLQFLGIKKGEHVSLLSENSAKWLIVDQAVLMNGAVDVVRGSQSPVSELEYVLTHSDSCALVVDTPDLVEKLVANKDLKFVICLFEDVTPFKNKFKFPVYSFEEVLELRNEADFQFVKINKDDLATIVYSSGTTGNPKGIMLSHGNILSQIINIASPIGAKPAQSALNILPIWHTYERIGEYYLLSRRCKLNYTNVRNFKKDLSSSSPHYLVSVPRLWESIYDGVMAEVKKQGQFKFNIFNSFLNLSVKYKKLNRILNNTSIDNLEVSQLEALSAKIKRSLLAPAHFFADKVFYSKIRNVTGKSFVAGISGGGALARHLEDFYEVVGIDIIVGYGLTETSPVLTCRRSENNVRYSVGLPIADTEIKIVHPETFRPVAKYEKGLVLVKGLQVMKGYYKDVEATNKVLSPEGWLNTGDIGWFTQDFNLVLTGRFKDTIVLSNGENIEPQSIEEACLTIPYIKQIILVGQDQAMLGALVTVNREATEKWAKQQKVPFSSPFDSLYEFKKFIHKEVALKVQSRPNYRPFERISCLKILDEEFLPENGLMTQTAKIKRHEVFKRYDKVIQEMFKN